MYIPSTAAVPLIKAILVCYTLTSLALSLSPPPPLAISSVSFFIQRLSSNNNKEVIILQVSLLYTDTHVQCGYREVEARCAAVGSSLVLVKNFKVIN